MRLIIALIFGAIAVSGSVKTTVPATDPLVNVNEWNADRLKKHGMTFRLWKHEAYKGIPSHEGLEVKFDISSLKVGEDVSIEALFYSKIRRTPILRVKRVESDEDSVTLLFAVLPDYQSKSCLAFNISGESWRGIPARGYRISIARTIELGREQYASKEPQTETCEAALLQLTDLLDKGKLSKQTQREITETALTIQGDLSRPWSGAWGNWIEYARAQGAVSDAEFKKYAEQSNSEWEFRAHRAVDMHNTGRFGLEFVLTHLGGRVASVYSPHGLEISHKIIELTVERIPIIEFDGRDGGTKSFTSTTEAGHGRGWFRTPDEIPSMETLKSGKHQATIILEEEIYESQRPDRILKRNRIELKDEFEYYRNLYFPEHNKQVDAHRTRSAGDFKRYDPKGTTQ